MSFLPFNRVLSLGIGLSLTLATHLAAAQGTIAKQDSSTEKETRQVPVLQEVEVTAPRITETNASGLFRDASALTPLLPATNDAASLLRDIPGVSLQTGGGVSSLPVLHGMADDRLRTKVNGIDLISSCPNHMNPPLSYIDPTNVHSVEVFAGITPVSVGGDSIGGTIQVDSAPPEFAAPGAETLFKGKAGTFYRSNGSAFGGNLSLKAAGEKFGMSYAGSTAQSKNYQAAKAFKASGLAATDRDWLDGDEVGSSRYKVHNHELGLAARHDRHILELKLDFQDIPYQGFPNQRMDMTLNESILGNLHYTGTYRWGTLQTRLYDENTRHRMDFADDKQFLYTTSTGLKAPGMPMNTDGQTLGAEIKGEIILSERDLLRLGIEGQRYRLDDWWPPSPSVLPAGFTYGGMAPNTFWNINDGQRDRLDVYAEWEARWNPQWLTQMGIRNDNVFMDTGTIQGYNNVSTGMGVYGDPASPTSVPGKFNAADRNRTDNNLDLTALVRYTPGARYTLETGYARKMRSPNLYERYSWSTTTMAMEMINLAGDGNYYLGNLNLEPETAHTFSATANFHGRAKDRWGLKVTPYFTHIEDYIDVQRCPADVCTNPNGTTSSSTSNVVKSLTATTGFVYLQFVNQSADLFGLDLSSHLLLADTEDYGRFTSNHALNHVGGENKTTGDNLYNIMPLNGKLSLVHEKDRWTNTIEEILVAPKDDVSQTRNEVKTGGYGLLNLRTSYEWDRFRLDFGVENTLDQFYNLPLGGAYVGQGASMGTSLAWGTSVPGMGRTIYGGMTVSF
ncbi:MAG: TonB-dependent receptor [Magnetococcales bacterium]|nr:TonB-dependent receptor [Magnetococcales bacterium]